MVEATTDVSAPAMLAMLAPRVSSAPKSQGELSAVAELAAASEMWGEAAIPLCSGDPDLPTPPHVTAAVIDALQRDAAEKTIHYESGPGLLRLRQAISNHMKTNYQQDYEPDDIVVSLHAPNAVLPIDQKLRWCTHQSIMLARANMSYSAGHTGRANGAHGLLPSADCGG